MERFPRFMPRHPDVGRAATSPTPLHSELTRPSSASCDLWTRPGSLPECRLSRRMSCRSRRSVWRPPPSNSAAPTQSAVMRSDADMAVAVDKGFTAKTIDALRSRGVSDREVDNLIINPRTLSHRRANRSKVTVEESDRAAGVARAVALAEKTFANRDKAHRWLHKHLSVLGGRTPMEFIRTDAGARIVESLLARIFRGAPA